MGYSMKMGSKEMHSPINFKNNDAKLLSLSKGLFSVDTTVETEQKNLTIKIIKKFYRKYMG